MTHKYRVDVYEYESGWGSRLDFQRDFDEKPEAEQYVTEFNSKNDKSEVPDWYMVASSPRLIDLEAEGNPRE